jgi:hypothetical protein
MDRMITYYRDDSVEITSLAVLVDGRTYPLRELGRVWHRAGGRDAAGRRTLLTRAAFAVAPLAPIVAALAVAAIALRADVSTGNRIVLFTVAGILALATVPLLDVVLGRVESTYDRGTRVHEIWARWRDREVLLVRTGDKTRFGRIYRALERALESVT